MDGLEYYNGIIDDTECKIHQVRDKLEILECGESQSTDPSETDDTNSNEDGFSSSFSNVFWAEHLNSKNSEMVNNVYEEHNYFIANQSTDSRSLDNNVPLDCQDIERNVQRNLSVNKNCVKITENILSNVQKDGDQSSSSNDGSEFSKPIRSKDSKTSCGVEVGNSDVSVEALNARTTRNSSSHSIERGDYGVHDNKFKVEYLSELCDKNKDVEEESNILPRSELAEVYEVTEENLKSFVKFNEDGNELSEINKCMDNNFSDFSSILQPSGSEEKVTFVILDQLCFSSLNNSISSADSSENLSGNNNNNYSYDSSEPSGQQEQEHEHIYNNAEVGVNNNSVNVRSTNYHDLTRTSVAIQEIEESCKDTAGPIRYLTSVQMTKTDDPNSEHMKRVSSEENEFPPKKVFRRPCCCSTCGKCFPSKSKLAIHERIHTGEKPFQCQHCGKQFCQKEQLNEHLRIHTGEKPYKCKFCDRNFTVKNTLSKHLRIHTGEKPFQCLECGKRFSVTDSFNKHLRTHTGEKPYPCQYCGTTFATKYTLTSHMRRHTGEKPFHCQQCGKQFAQKCNLNLHLKTHEGEKPFQCQKCGKLFSQKSNLTSHMKIHSGE